jgi:DNA-binding GntR family transcriptional regulator
MNQNPDPPKRVETNYRSLTQIISGVIRKNIYEGVYKPGDRLNILDLAQEFSASSIPVREALRNLEAEGLVDFRPNRGVVIRELSADEVRELFLMRLPLEVLAATQASHRADKSAFTALENMLKRMDEVAGTQEWHSLHEQFHHEFYTLSRLPRLTQFINVLRGQMRPYSELYLANADHLSHAQAEHYAMIAAAAEHDVAKLRTIIREHLKRPAKMALAAFGVTELPEFDVPAEA